MGRGRTGPAPAAPACGPWPMRTAWAGPSSGPGPGHETDNVTTHAHRNATVLAGSPRRRVVTPSRLDIVAPNLVDLGHWPPRSQAFANDRLVPSLADVDQRTPSSSTTSDEPSGRMIGSPPASASDRRPRMRVTRVSSSSIRPGLVWHSRPSISTLSTCLMSGRSERSLLMATLFDRRQPPATRGTRPHRGVLQWARTGRGMAGGARAACAASCGLLEPG